jgi:hypothetical protein
VHFDQADVAEGEAHVERVEISARGHRPVSADPLPVCQQAGATRRFGSPRQIQPSGCHAHAPRMGAGSAASACSIVPRYRLISGFRRFALL